MTYRLPRKRFDQSDLKIAANWAFLRGYLVCLANLTHGGLDIDNNTLAAWKNIGSPTAADCRKAGLTDFDRKACNYIRAQERAHEGKKF